MVLQEVSGVIVQEAIVANFWLYGQHIIYITVSFGHAQKITKFQSREFWKDAGCASSLICHFARHAL